MKVLNLLIGDITKTLREQDVYLKTNLKCRSLLLKKGYSSEYGARSLRRVVEKELLDRIAEVLLARKDRPLFIAITAKEGAFELSTKPLKDAKKRK
jgi:ATP-dependent Clp protease ATP-binding subunit ClpA